MADPAESRVPCPACGTRYKWNTELAGRKLKCRCGALIRMPKAPSGEATLERAAAAPSGIHPATESPPPPSSPQPAPNKNPDDGYDLELPDLAALSPPQSAAALNPVAPPKPAGPTGRCPSCGQPVKPTAVICLGCGYNLQSGQKIQTALGDEEVSAPKPPGRGSTAFVPKSAAIKPAASGLVVALKIIAIIFNAVLVIFGGLSLLRLNPCGILCFLCTGLYNIITLVKGSIAGAALVFSIICNALTMLMGLFVAAAAVMFLSGVLTKMPQYQQLAANKAIPPWFFQFLGVVLGCMAVVLLLASLTTFAAVMMSRER